MTAIAQPLSASLENYLETIFLLIQEKTVARSKDISAHLGVNRSSVTGALQALRERGLVNYEPYGYVTLTHRGTEVAERVFRRHEVLKDFFVKVLSIDEEEADEAACRMEHGISKHIVDRLVEFAEYMEICPRAGAKWSEESGYHCHHVPSSIDDCERCVAQCLKDVKRTLKEGKTAGMSMTLKELKPGEKGQIVKVGGSGAIRRRIRDMGVTSGSLVEVIRVAPLGDPIDIKVKGYHLTLRKEDAADITIGKVE